MSPPNRQSKSTRRKRRSRSSSNKYLKPGALAQLRYSKSAASKSCTDLVKRRVPILDLNTKKSDDDLLLDEAVDQSPAILSPINLCKQSSLIQSSSSIDTEKEDKEMALEESAANKSPILLSPINFFKLNRSVASPRTPRDDSCNTESRLESLPMDLLVKILCHLHHDQLRAVFHVSQRIRKAAVTARQHHFNYTTPDRSRQEMLRTTTPLPTEHWPFKSSRGEGKGGVFIMSPHTPKAPRHGPRPPSRLKVTEMRQIAAVLFQDSSFPSRCMVPSVLSKPLCKSLASNRVLFYEDELCQAVAKNKLR